MSQLDARASELRRSILNEHLKTPRTLFFAAFICFAGGALSLLLFIVLSFLLANTPVASGSFEQIGPDNIDELGELGTFELTEGEPYLLTFEAKSGILLDKLSVHLHDPSNHHKLFVLDNPGYVVKGHARESISFTPDTSGPHTIVAQLQKRDWPFDDLDGQPPLLLHSARWSVAKRETRFTPIMWCCTMPCHFIAGAILIGLASLMRTRAMGAAEREFRAEHEA